jgi:hypothetical protein
LDPTASIRRLGFRKWYERELIKCHGALVTCFLAGLLVAALMESVAGQLSWSWGSAGRLGIVFVAALVAWASWRSYITILGRAELYGERSSCPQCQAYGLFNVLATGLDHVPSAAAVAVAPLETAWLRVQCRKCGTAWRMPD